MKTKKLRQEDLQDANIPVFEKSRNNSDVSSTFQEEVI
jgi:hypothetical protein